MQVVMNVRTSNLKTTLIRSLEERQSEQPRLLSICREELEEVYGQEREQNQSRRQLLIPSHLQNKEKLLGQRKLLPSEASEPTPHRNVFVISPEERHSDQPTWESILLSIGETELGRGVWSQT